MRAAPISLNMGNPTLPPLRHMFDEIWSLILERNACITSRAISDADRCPNQYLQILVLDTQYNHDSAGSES